MARIAGVVTGEASVERESLVQRVLSKFPAAGARGRCVLSGARATMGAVFEPGRLPEASVAEHDGVLVALEGTLFNRHELPSHATEPALIADLHRRHGFVGALERLNGDFAIALHDSRTDTLWLGRDRFGVKPLYYAMWGDGSLAFASTPAELRVLPGVPGDVDRRFVARFAGLHYRYFDNPTEGSPYAAIRQLPPATALRFERSSSSLVRYWDLHEAEDLRGSEAELAEAYRALLLDAVRIRYLGAPCPAFTLSGGMDSSSVLGCAVHVTGEKQLAYSSTYEDRTYDESDDIQVILDATVQKWRTVPVGDPDVISLVRRMVAANGEPVATATWLSHYLLCEASAKDGIGTLFGGLGGDELNAGEYEYFFFFFADLIASGQRERLDAEVAKWVEYHDHPIYKKSRATLDAALARLVDLAVPGRCKADLARMHRYDRALAPDWRALNEFDPEMDHPFRSYLKNRTYQDIYRETSPCCLRAADRHTQEFGLEVRWPFFDHRLAEMMFRVDGTLKFRDGVTKFLLREAMRGIVPEATRTRIKKTGWNAPAHVWFAGPQRDTVRDLIRSRAFRERGIYDVVEVERLLDEHREIVETGKLVDNHMMFFWQLVNVELWLQSLEA